MYIVKRCVGKTKDDEGRENYITKCGIGGYVIDERFWCI